MLLPDLTAKQIFFNSLCGFLCTADYVRRNISVDFLYK
jgi:hypothetical protein